QSGRMRAHFHAEPMIRATELVLQERIPRDIAAVTPRLEAVAVPDSPSALDMQRMALIEGTPQGPPISHILSNGSYSVMLTATGGGYSRWGDIALTRWQADATRDTGGTRIWLRDLQTGEPRRRTRRYGYGHPPRPRPPLQDKPGRSSHHCAGGPTRRSVPSA